jgi:hypothetical protein
VLRRLTLLLAALLPAMAHAQTTDKVLQHIREAKAITIAYRTDAAPFSCTITVTGGAPAADCPTLSRRWMGGAAIEFDSTPCEVEIEVRSGDEVVLERTVRPHYEWSEPWGEGCDWAGSATEQL